jgi:hypothetical protein
MSPIAACFPGTRSNSIQIPKMKEFFQRARIAIAILVGFGLGKTLSLSFDQHPSEFFAGGFLLGVLATQGLFWWWLKRKPPGKN